MPHPPVKPVAELPQPLPDNPVTHLYRAATDTGWYAMGAVLNGGLTLSWVCRALGATWHDLYASAAVPPSRDDPIFLPHLHGERTPHLDTGLRGAWTGLNPRHDRAHLLRSALEGVAFAVRDALEHLVQPSDGVTHLRIAGGGTTDTAWRKMLADILGYPLAPVDVAAASGLGAALLAARAAGFAAPDTQAHTALGNNDPNLEDLGIYRERYHEFATRTRALRRSSDVTENTHLSAVTIRS